MIKWLKKVLGPSTKEPVDENAGKPGMTSPVVIKPSEPKKKRATAKKPAAKKKPAKAKAKK